MGYKKVPNLRKISIASFFWKIIGINNRQFHIRLPRTKPYFSDQYIRNSNRIRFGSCRGLLNAHNSDVLEDLREKITAKMICENPEVIEKAIISQHTIILNEAAKVFTGELNEYIENVRKTHEQKIDLSNPDEALNVGWAKDSQPYRRRELTYSMIKEVLEKLQNEKPALTPIHLWQAYEALKNLTL